jgi:predicted tellurium resistance membrane protein TerC
MDFFSSPDLWIAFVTLLLLEIVLGIDNVVFISILADKLPSEQRRRHEPEPEPVHLRDKYAE